MIIFEDECVNCGLPCLGTSCPNRNVRRCYCDKCNEESEKLFKYEGEQLCEECLLESVTEVNE